MISPGEHQKQNLLIWILAPLLETTDANLEYYYDYTSSQAEFTKAFAELGLAWTWQWVTKSDYQSVIDRIVAESSAKQPVFFNLCDGDEINDVPGISVVRYLEQKGVVYTGSNAHFYEITTSKIPMKEAFDLAGVPNAAWEELDPSGKNIPGIFERLGSPLILKPAVSGGSMGLSLKSVVDTEADLQEQLRLLHEGYRGWNLSDGGVLVEQFINGPEYTTFLIGPSVHPDRCILYPAVERVFPEALPERERFLSFDRLYEFYEDEMPVGEEVPLYTYHPPAPALVNRINQISLDAYCALDGQGYGRVDIRMDKTTGNLYILEVNAQCGISEDENQTSIGAILRFAHAPFSQIVWEIIEDALNRKSA
jgi:D-alanine-D-alanine ligase